MNGYFQCSLSKWDCDNTFTLFNGVITAYSCLLQHVPYSKQLWRGSKFKLTCGAESDLVGKWCESDSKTGRLWAWDWTISVLEQQTLKAHLQWLVPMREPLIILSSWTISWFLDVKSLCVCAFVCLFVCNEVFLSYFSVNEGTGKGLSGCR